MDNKLFSIAGTSTLNGVNTYRFATGKVSVRTNKLKRHGHTDIDLTELPEPMTKVDAIAYLVNQGIKASIPVTGRSKVKAVELSPEQIAEAEAAEKLRLDALAKEAANDSAYFSSLVDEDVEVVYDSITSTTTLAKAGGEDVESLADLLAESDTADVET